jgi:hypothetical protein
MLPAASNAQPESQAGYVPPVIGNCAVQGRVPDPHHVNVNNYRIADYPLLPDVRNYIYMSCVVSAVLLTITLHNTAGTRISAHAGATSKRYFRLCASG